MSGVRMRGHTALRPDRGQTAVKYADGATEASTRII